MENKLPISRRLKTSVFMMISQAMLVALAIAWVIQMVIIAANGSVYFVEDNHFILWAEIIVSVFITGFAIFILVTQIQRLGEKGLMVGTRATRCQVFPALPLISKQISKQYLTLAMKFWYNRVPF